MKQMISICIWDMKVLYCKNNDNNHNNILFSERKQIRKQMLEPLTVRLPNLFLPYFNLIACADVGFQVVNQKVQFPVKVI